MRHAANLLTCQQRNKEGNKAERLERNQGRRGFSDTPESQPSCIVPECIASDYYSYPGSVCVFHRTLHQTLFSSAVCEGTRAAHA